MVDRLPFPLSGDGAVTELENLYRRDGEFAYRVVTRQRTAAGWKEMRNVRYLRTEVLAWFQELVRHG